MAVRREGSTPSSPTSKKGVAMDREQVEDKEFGEDIIKGEVIDCTYDLEYSRRLEYPEVCESCQ